MLNFHYFPLIVRKQIQPSLSLFDAPSRLLVIILFDFIKKKNQKHTPLLCVSGTKRSSGVDLDFHTRDHL